GRERLVSFDEKLLRAVERAEGHRNVRMRLLNHLLHLCARGAIAWRDARTLRRRRNRARQREANPTQPMRAQPGAHGLCILRYFRSRFAGREYLMRASGRFDGFDFYWFSGE